MCRTSSVRRVADPLLAADLTADVFLAAIDAAGSYRSSRGAPSAWLFGIARNVVAAEHRRAGRERCAQARIDGRRLLDPDDIARMQERIDAAARAREMHKALAGLPDGERAVFELIALDDLSPSEAAAALGIRPITARVRLHRARAGAAREPFPRRRQPSDHPTRGGMTMTAPTFEDRLLEQLRNVVAAQPAPAARPHRRRLAVTGVGAAAAASAGAVVAVVGTSERGRVRGPGPLPDGAVSVSIHSLSDAGGLQEKLRAAGVPAVVDYVPAGEGSCTAPGAAPPPGGAHKASSTPAAPSCLRAGPTETRQAPDGAAKGVERAKVTSSLRTGGDGVPSRSTPATSVLGSTSTSRRRPGR